MRACRILLFLPFLPGCLACGYPSVCRTPLVSVPEENVRAFRVVSDSELSGPVITGPIQFSRETTELPIVASQVAPQQDAYFAYCWLAFPFQGDHTRTMRVVLYRPGFETVEVDQHPWWEFARSSDPEKVVWKEAPTLAAQQEALEKVLGRFLLETSRPDRKMLEFGAQEYARLAASPPANSGPKGEQIALEEQARKYNERLAELEPHK